MKEGKKKNSGNNLKWIILAFSLSLLLHEICNFFIPIIHFNPDELGAISAAAKLAGKDWNCFWSAEQSYYGIVSGLLFTPAFLLIKNPFILYQIMLFIVAVIHASTSIFAFDILNRELKHKDPKYTVCGSVACSFFTAWRATNVMNEAILIFCVWVIFYLLYIMQVRQSKSSLILKTIGINVFLGIALLSHTRAIIIVLAVIVTLVLYRIIQKRNLVNIPVFFLSFIVIWFGTQVIINIVQQEVFAVGTLQVANNSIGDIAGGLGVNDSGIRRLSLKGMTGFFDMLSSNLYSIFIVSVGMVFLGVWQFLGDFIDIIISFVRKEKSNENKNLLAWGNMFCIVGLVGSLVGYALINWSFALYAKQTNWIISYYLYPRYFGIFFGPILISIIVKLEKKHIKYWFLSICSFVIITLYAFSSYIYQYSQQGGDVFDSWRVTAPFTFAINWRAERYFVHYVVAAIVAALLFLIVLVVFRYSKKIGIILLLAVLYYEYLFNAVVFERGIANYTLDMVDDTYALFNSQDELNRTINDIYIDAEVNRRVPYVLQFLFPDKNIILGIPEDIDNIDNIVVFASTEPSEELDDIAYIKLDDDEYLYVKGKELQQYFKEHNIEILEK